MALVERVTPYIPSCSAHSSADFEQEWQSRGEYFNLSNAGDYVLHQLLPSVIPGIVFGTLALIGFLLFIVWMFVDCCCVPCCRRRFCRFCRCCLCCDWREGKLPEGPEVQDQFISGTSGTIESAPALYPDSKPAKPARCGGRCTGWKALFWAFFWGCVLTTVGIGAWGLATSINLTDTTFSEFWQIVDDAQQRVEDSIKSLEVLKSGTQNLTTSAGVLASPVAQTAVTAGLQKIPGVDASQASTAASYIAQIPNVLQVVPDGLQSGIDFLSESVNGTFTDVEDTFKPPTMAVQNTWRFIPLAVLFGVLIAMVLLVGWAVWFMTWPRTTCFLVALLWLVVCLLMWLGAGLLNGVYVFSDDACLYAESFLVSFARNKAPDSAFGDVAVFAVRYYLGDTSVAEKNVTINGQTVDLAFLETLPAQANNATSELGKFLADFKVGADQLFNATQNPLVLAAISSPIIREAVKDTGEAAFTMAAAVVKLASVATRVAITPIYVDIKEYICCTISDNMYNMWVAWTVAGCLGFVVALMATGRIFYYTNQARKRLRASWKSMPGAAPLWRPDGPPQAAEAGLGQGPKDGFYDPPAVQAVDSPSGYPPAAAGYPPPAGFAAAGGKDELLSGGSDKPSEPSAPEGGRFAGYPTI